MSVNQRVKQLHREAQELKEDALIETDIDLYRQASNKYRELSNLIGELIEQNPPNLNFVEAVQSQFYYSYSCEECLTAYYLRVGHYEDSINHAKEAIKICKKWLDEIISNLKSRNLNDEDQDKIERYINYWQHSLLTMEAKLLEPQASIKDKEKKYVQAWDIKNKMLKKQKAAHEHAENSGLEESFIRTAKGNYYALVSNAAQGMVKILNDKIEKKKDIQNVGSQLFKHLVQAYENASKAFEANPEKDEYNIGATNLLSEIKNLLNSSKVNWYNLFVDFQDNPYALGVMEKINKTKFNIVKAQRSGLERKLAVIFGIVSLVLLGVVAIFFPCPTTFQYMTFRILISLGMGAATMMLTGSLSFNNPFVKATGALAVFAVVYFFNPAELVINDDCFNQEVKVEGIILRQGKLLNGIQITNLESEVSRNTNSNGKFEMSIPSNFLEDDALNFRIQMDGLDTIITIKPAENNLKKIKIEI